MIILDTNVVSETMHAAPSATVLDWLNAQARNTMFISAVTVGELNYGIECLPGGKRKDALKASYLTLIDKTFAGRVLEYDDRAADLYGLAMATARACGLTVSIPDGIIAGIALARDFGVATRDTAPYLAMGVSTVIDPWTEKTWRRDQLSGAPRTYAPYDYRITSKQERTKP